MHSATHDLELEARACAAAPLADCCEQDAEVRSRVHSTLPYVLITPARNEARFIERTLESVVAQTWRPLRWYVVDDGSTDHTAEIVSKYAAIHPWIELVRMPRRAERSFAGKAHAFHAAYDKAVRLDFAIVGNLDADVAVEPDHFRALLDKFSSDPLLGVAGSPFREGTRQYDYRYTSIEHVSGACQLFRRECFERIGGYVPIEGGGIDWVAVTTARMMGWKTRTFCDTVCTHHRTIGTAETDTLRARFRQGAKDYRLGGHVAWQCLRSVYQMRSTPYVLGGAAILLGYLCALASGAERPVSRELVAFHRREQLARLRRLVASSGGRRG